MFQQSLSSTFRWQYRGEHQYVVAGCVDENSLICLHFETETNVADKTRGMTINQMLTSPLWRV